MAMTLLKDSSLNAGWCAGSYYQSLAPAEGRSTPSKEDETIHSASASLLQLASAPGVSTEAPPRSIRFDDELADDAAPQQASPLTDSASSLEVHEHRETELP